MWLHSEAENNDQHIYSAVNVGEIPPGRLSSSLTWLSVGEMCEAYASSVWSYSLSDKKTTTTKQQVEVLRRRLCIRRTGRQTFSHLQPNVTEPNRIDQLFQCDASKSWGNFRFSLPARKNRLSGPASVKILRNLLPVDRGVQFLLAQSEAGHVVQPDVVQEEFGHQLVLLRFQNRGASYG